MTLEARHVFVSRDGATLLEDVSLTVTPGQAVAVIGPNGAGKSTALRVLTGEWTAGRGEVMVRGRRLDKLTLGARAQTVAVLPQHSGLDFPFAAIEVISMGRMPWGGTGVADRRIVEEVIARLDLGALSHRRYTTLSGGEKQRVQLARVLAQLWDNPQEAFFLLDEPTAPLDLLHQLVLTELIADLKSRGAGFLVVMHDIALASSFADRLVLMAGGEVVCTGTAEQVIAPATLKAAYGVDVDVVSAPGGARAVFARRPVTSDD